MAHGVASTEPSPDSVLRSAAILLAVCAAVTWVFACWWISQRDVAREYTYRVSAIIPGIDEAHPYGVDVEGPHGGFSFRRPPGLDVGDELVAQYDRAGRYLGWSAFGRFTAKQEQPSDVVFFLPLGVGAWLTAIAVYLGRSSLDREPRS